jgi:hypothetical protein
VHHLRSLQLAVRARKDPALLPEALFEHAFALHFVQDAFSVGHLVAPVSYGEDDRLRHHDHYNRTGLPITWTGYRGTCHSQPRDDDGPCWVAPGDAFLSLRVKDPKRVRAALAVARFQAAFAAALDTRWLTDADATPELFERIHPQAPTSTLDDDWPQQVEAALQRLGAAARLQCVSSQQALIDDPDVGVGQVVGERVRGAAAHVDADALAAGTAPPGSVSGSLLLPLIAAWPTPQQHDIPPVQDAIARGPAIQLRASGLGLIGTEGTGTPSGAMMATLGGSYQIMGLFPGVPARPAFEINLGFGHAAARGDWSRRGPDAVALWVLELRHEILGDLLWHTLWRALDIDFAAAGRIQLLGGSRMGFETHGPSPRMLDFEVAGYRFGPTAPVSGNTAETFLSFVVALHAGVLWNHPMDDSLGFVGLGITGGYTHGFGFAKRAERPHAHPPR